MDFTWSPEQQALRSAVRRFAADEVLPRSAAIDRDGAMPAELMTGLAERDFYVRQLPPWADPWIARADRRRGASSSAKLVVARSPGRR